MPGLLKDIHVLYLCSCLCICILHLDQSTTPVTCESFSVQLFWIHAWLAGWVLKYIHVSKYLQTPPAGMSEYWFKLVLETSFNKPPKILIPWLTDCVCYEIFFYGLKHHVSRGLSARRTIRTKSSLGSSGRSPSTWTVGNIGMESEFFRCWTFLYLFRALVRYSWVFNKCDERNTQALYEMENFTGMLSAPVNNS